MDAGLIAKLLPQIKVLRAPRSTLSTFGATRIEYQLISPVEDLADKTRVRKGEIVSERPKILTAEALARRFKGFGPDAEGYAQWLTSAYADVLRSLEYTFRNKRGSTRVLNERPALVAERAAADLDSRDLRTQSLIVCPDAAWPLALMKFTLDEAARSFPTHVQDLDRRGLFNPQRAASDRRRAEIETLLAAAAAGDKSVRDALGSKLRDYGLFAEYEDRFLALF